MHEGLLWGDNSHLRIMRATFIKIGIASITLGQSGNVFNID
jgi:hypothetical protein